MCGAPVVNVDLLRRTCEYSMSQDNPHVRYLWEVLEHDFSNEERAAFLRFVSGRSRMPVTEAQARQPNCHLQVRPLECSDPDRFLPASHTCFFQVRPPPPPSFRACVRV